MTRKENESQMRARVAREMGVTLRQPRFRKKPPHPKQLQYAVYDLEYPGRYYGIITSRVGGFTEEELRNDIRRVKRP